MRRTFRSIFELDAAGAPRFVVLTGGSGVGKTTLIDRLAALGHRTVPEAAMRVIDALNSLLDDGATDGGGPRQQLAWRTAHKSAFGALLGAVALTQEARAAADPSAGVVFLDRSVLDNLGYARVRGYEPPAFLTEGVVAEHARRIDKVFVLEEVASNHADVEARDAQSGRAADPS
eukprot:832330-Prymnesium_polylepis.3